jgi:ankyrin repeat protein
MEKFLNKQFLDEVNNNNLANVELLLKAGADVNFKDAFGYTVLMKASENGYIDMVRLLLNKNANINLQNEHKYGYTALMLAAYNGHTDVVQLLLNNNADVNFKTIFGYTALMIASQNCYTDVVNELLNKNVDINLRNNIGKTAYDFAKTDEIKKLLKGKNIIEAIKNNNVEQVKQLITKNNEILTNELIEALIYSSLHHYKEIENMILEISSVEGSIFQETLKYVANVCNKMI